MYPVIGATAPSHTRGKKMKTLEFYGKVYPAYYVVCPRCYGEGKHVNPSIDGNGITQSEMAEILHEDPDFLDNYMGGMYDVTCHQCKGQRVVLEVDEHSCTKEQWDEYQQDCRDDWELAAMEAAERRMGA